MFIIERLNDSSRCREEWIPEIQCKTEFKAFLQARTKCMATGNTYRVFDSREQQVISLISLDRCKRHFGIH